MKRSFVVYEPYKLKYLPNKQYIGDTVMFESFKKKPKKERVAIIVLLSVVLFVILLSVLTDIIFPGSVFARIIDNSIGKFFNIANFFANSYVTILECVAIVFFLWLLDKLLAIFIKLFVKKGGRYGVIADIFRSFLKYGIVIAAIFMILDAWGVETKTLLAGAGILALAISFGAQSLIEDTISGIFLLFEKQFAVGDVVQVGDFRGVVKSIGLRITKIEDINGDLKIINNSDIRGAINTSTAPSPAICDISVSYDEDIHRVEEVILSHLDQIRARIPEIQEGPYYQGVQKLADSAVVIRIYARCPELKRYQVMRNINREMKILFDEHGIQIPFNQLVVHMNKEESPKKED